ncbi:MAG: glutamate synthase subunit beta [Lachnospiraceae bacterium]|nr:glutamate synthase subunit beta [Lachnospiraceae bacterium]
MGKATGFMEYERRCGRSRLPEDRTTTFEEFHEWLPEEEQRRQAARCMDCGVPFCQYGGMIAGMGSGCPLHNLVPETNDLVYRGNWEQAYRRLAKTHSFPEFTSRVCPALCEAACTCGYQAEPVSTKENERAIIDYAYAHGLVEEPVPEIRTGKRIAVVGSGPSGLAAAQLLNRRGHSVTVFERNDRIGGLLRYGIPNMKLEKRAIDRRVRLMEQAGVEFRCSVNVGVDVTAEELLEQYDRVLLCGGASNPRDIQIPGREAAGIYFAVDFLTEVSRRLMDQDYDVTKVIGSKDFSFGDLTGKQVLVIGGGDTGNDCVGTAIRLRAAGVTQLEMMPKPSEKRKDTNPWPEWPRILKTDYGQEEAIRFFGGDPRLYQTTATEFLKDEKGHVCGVKTVQLEAGSFRPVAGTEQELKADLVLIAAGFLGSQKYLTDAFGVELDRRTNIVTKGSTHRTSADRVFAAGDIRRGQSLVVWAIAEGREAARAIDEDLMGYTNL